MIILPCRGIAHCRSSAAPVLKMPQQVFMSMEIACHVALQVVIERCCSPLSLHKNILSHQFTEVIPG